MNRARMAEISSFFDDVYDEIDSEGWARGMPSQPWNNPGPCCVGHAMLRVAARGNRKHLLQPALRILADHVGGEGSPVSIVVRWNDRQRTSYVVLRVLEAIADKYRLPAGP